MKSLPFLIALALPTAAFSAESMEDKMKEYVNSELKAWFADPAVMGQLVQANTATMNLTQADIQAKDAQWQVEVGTNSELIKSILDNGASVILRERAQSTDGRVTEVILMSQNGLNVALSDVTSDYWQGDEDKYQKTFLAGPDAFHISEVELDESTQTYQAQVSFTLVDAAGQPIGAATVGLNAEKF